MQPYTAINQTAVEPMAPRALIGAVGRCLPGLQGQDWLPLVGGRTNRLWRVGRLVVKLYHPDQASPLFPNDPVAEARALALVAPSGLAPVLRSSGEGWIAYDHVEGRTWADDPAPVARALAGLHRIAPGATGFRHAPNGSHALAAQAKRIASACQGSLPALPVLDAVPPRASPCLIHGDAVPGNIIAGPQRVSLIDWQCPALGDPADDLAAFLSPAMQWLYRGAALTGPETAAFLAAYPNRDTVARYQALAPLFHWRMAAHCLWKAERGAKDYAAALQLELAACG